MSSTKRPMPPRPSALGRTPSFAPGPRAPMKPLAPIAPLGALPKLGASGESHARAPSTPAPAPYMDPDLLDGPTVTSFDPPPEDFPVPHSPSRGDTEEIAAAHATYDDPTELEEDLEIEEEPQRPVYSRPPPAPPSSRSVPPPRHSTPPPRAASMRPPPSSRSVPPPRPSVPAPRHSTPAPRPSFPAPGRSVPPAANPFMAPSQPPPAAPMFDDVNTAFAGKTNMAPNFGALEARTSRAEWNMAPLEVSPPPARARMATIDLGEGVVVETLAGFEPNRNKAEVSEAWRPEGLPPTDVFDKPNVMRLESVQPPPPMRAPMMTATALVQRPPAPSIDLQAEVARANQGRVRVAYVIAAISILLLLVAILSAVLSMS